jgi:hypothetical protein
MLNDPNKINFVYATTATGQVVKVVLPGSADRDYITQYLLKANAGVTLDNINYTSFSLNPPTPIDQDKLKSIISESVAPTDFPPFPTPGPSGFCALWSTLLVKNYVSLNDLTSRNIQFCMKQIINEKVICYLDVLTMPITWFKNLNDYYDLHSGNIGLLHGVAWNNVAEQNVSSGDSWITTKGITTGFKDTTQLSISATLGASGGGFSASLTVTFSQTFETSSESTSSAQITVNGEPDETLNAVLWQLNDLIYLVRKDPNTGEFTFLDSYQLEMDNTNYVTSGNPFTLIPDSAFFGNTDVMDDGKMVITQLLQPTDRTQVNHTP